mmetsp:Transcript_108997/g.307205  ORF Transcript_108997/g.307205 Transcript_108997/m.307205 type:complete len:260 (+) Transcript_108997:245-1024(+)
MEHEAPRGVGRASREVQKDRVIDHRARRHYSEHHHEHDVHVFVATICEDVEGRNGTSRNVETDLRYSDLQDEQHKRERGCAREHLRLELTQGAALDAIRQDVSNVPHEWDIQVRLLDVHFEAKTTLPRLRRRRRVTPLLRSPPAADERAKQQQNFAHDEVVAYVEQRLKRHEKCREPPCELTDARILDEALSDGADHSLVHTQSASHAGRHLLLEAWASKLLLARLPETSWLWLLLLLPTLLGLLPLVHRGRRLHLHRH